MDIKEIIDDVRDENQEEREEQNIDTASVPPLRLRKKKFGKKALVIFSLIILALAGIAGFLFLKQKNTPVLTGAGGQGVFPANFAPKPIPLPSSFIKTQKPATGIPSSLKTKQSPVAKPSDVKPKEDNTLNDLFTVQYKHKKPKSLLPNTPLSMPENMSVPAVSPNMSMPNFNIKNMAAKLKNMSVKSETDTFTVSGESGGYVVVSCGKNTSYLKVGDGSCGYVLLKADSSGAVFSRSGKIKKIAY